MEAVCCQPIDTIKTRLQLDHHGKYKGRHSPLQCYLYSWLDASGSHLLIVTGIYNCGQTIIKEEGVRSLWKGLTPFATHLTLKYALRMGTNATYQSLLRDQVHCSDHACQAMHQGAA